MSKAIKETDSQKKGSAIMSGYNRFCDRTHAIEELDEETIIAILTLHYDGVALESIQEAYVMPLPILQFIIAPQDEKWEAQS